jgi:DNA-directed RNA polymerase specialized sigma subunit
LRGLRAVSELARPLLHTEDMNTRAEARTGGQAPKKVVSRSIARRNELATQHHLLVGKVARRLLRKLPAHVELDDLIAMGMLGLLEAADRFDPGRGEKFEAFAEFRIRGRHAGRPPVARFPVA